MSNVLVTGGAGFLGSHVADELIVMGHKVVVLDDLSGGRIENVPREATFINGNVCDERCVNFLFNEFKFEYVFHLAAYAAEGLSHFIKRFNYRNNLDGSCTLINASVNTGTVKAFVFTSSIAVYGKQTPPFTEDMIPRPEDSYGIAKYAVEQELCISHEMFGLPYIIFRPHNVYGERQNLSDRYRNVIGIFMNQIMRGEPMTIFGDGEQKRAFSYIGDVAPVIARSIEYPQAYGEVFNVGSDIPYTVNYLAEAVARNMGIEPKVIHLPARNEAVSAYAWHGKAVRMLGLHEATPLERGLKQMAKWAKTVGKQEPSRFGAIEIEKNLPPSWRAS